MRPELETACARYRPALGRRLFSGRVGLDAGAGSGSSLEFLDFRDYVPGDDPRHVDWRSFARTDQVKVRLFREEVSPTVEIIGDLSASMAVTPEKERAARDLLGAYAFWAREGGGRARRLRSGGVEFEDEETVAFAPAARDERTDADAGLLPHAPLRARTVRVLVSDFLFPADPAPFIRRIAAGAAHLDVIQLLDPWEIDPASTEPLTLVDCETGRRQELVLTRSALEAYAQRLTRLSAAVELASRAAGARFARVVASSPESMLRDGLLARGLVEPAG